MNAYYFNEKMEIKNKTHEMISFRVSFLAKPS